MPTHQSLLVPPLGIEPGPTEPESVILSFKLQGHPVKDCKFNNFSSLTKYNAYRLSTILAVGYAAGLKVTFSSVTSKAISEMRTEVPETLAERLRG